MFVKYFDSVSSLVAMLRFSFDILSPLFILISLYIFLYKGQVYDTVTVDNVLSAFHSSATTCLPPGVFPPATIPDAADGD